MDISATGLIEPRDLAALLEKNPDGVRLVDASYSNAAAANFSRARIGNAVLFDIDEIADPHAPLPHTIPAPADFAAAVSSLGISDGDPVVVYDQTGIHMAASRAWWMFRLFGHENVCVLNGGLPAWQAAGLPLNAAPPATPEPGRFAAHFRPELVRSMSDVLKASQDNSFVIVDARSADRFTGRVAEAKPGMRSGHIPNSRNLPFMNLLNSTGHALKSAADAAPLLEAYEDGAPVAVSCGSGVTACVVALALFRAGRRDIAIYDGSWTEWGAEESGMPVTA